MSAAELIEQIKALPPEEIEIVRNFLVNGDKSEPWQPQYVDREEARLLMDRIMEENAELFRRLAE